MWKTMVLNEPEAMDRQRSPIGCTTSAKALISGMGPVVLVRGGQFSALGDQQMGLDVGRPQRLQQADGVSNAAGTRHADDDPAWCMLAEARVQLSPP
jgi:hypothetical protein